MTTNVSPNVIVREIDNTLRPLEPPSEFDQTPAVDLEACKEGPQTYPSNEYKRDRDGSKKRESKIANRAKAKAAKQSKKRNRK